MSNNIFKYIFIIIVIGLIGFGSYKMTKNDKEKEKKNIDQTSTINNIQTDLRLAVCNFDTINPLLSNNRNIQQISKIIFEPLVTLNENYKKEYCLAEEIAKTDDLNYLIKLRKGVLWHDGSTFTADDVIFTVDRIKRDGLNTPYNKNLEKVTEISKIDDYTLKITLSSPEDFFEYQLTFPILSKKYFDGEAFATTDKNVAPVGTGMFKIDNVDSNVIKLVLYDNYWNTFKKPMSKQVNINLYGSAGELYNAFKNGEVDIVDVKISNVEQYIGSIGYKKIEYKSREYDFLSFNTQNEILSDKEVRKAIGKMLDKNNIVASCLGSGYVTSNFSLDMGNWLYTKDVVVEQNSDAAKQLLEQAGWEYKNNKWKKKVDYKTLELGFSIAVNANDEKRRNVAENIKNQLANNGIIVSIKELNEQAYSDALNNKNYDMILTGIRCGYSPNVSTFFREGNIANYSNEEIKEILKIVSNTSDENDLYEKYNRLYDIYLEDMPYIGLYRNTDVVIYNQGLIGNIKANTYNLYQNIEKWYRQ